MRANLPLLSGHFSTGQVKRNSDSPESKINGPLDRSIVGGDYGIRTRDLFHAIEIVNSNLSLPRRLLTKNLNLGVQLNSRNR
jgi:hypothetical protein